MSEPRHIRVAIDKNWPTYIQGTEAKLCNEYKQQANYWSN